MRSFLFIIGFVFSLTNISLGQVWLFDGVVYDEFSNPLPGVAISVYPLGQGTLTNEQGHFSIKLPRGAYTVVFSFLGYRTDSLSIEITEPMTRTHQLVPSTVMMEEIVVVDQSELQQVEQTETGLIHVRKEDMENMPFLFGEVDPVRMIQLMPGVHTAGEGSTGFYVRGGAVDQNLIQLDNTVVYNPSHLFGFFSIFNGSTIHAIDLYKSGIPADHGGRLSSVMRVTTRKGDMQEFHGEGSVGLIAANLVVEGPITKNKGSFLLAARRTYVDLFLEPLRDLKLLKYDVNYYFYDLNLNTDYQISSRDNIRLRGYLGQDDFDYEATNDLDNLIQWKNVAASLTWQHNFRSNLYSELSVNTSRYDMGFGASINTYSFNVNSGILDQGATWNLNWNKGKHAFSTGVTYTHHTLKPNNVNAASDEVELEVSPTITLKAEEVALFLNDKIKFSDRLEFSIGLRFTNYRQLGPFTRYIEDENFQVLDTLFYGPKKTIKQYQNLEPRLAIRYSVTPQSSVKLSYDRTTQYMHMAPLSSVSLPLDIWVPSSSTIKPQYADQISLGYFRNLSKHFIESSVSVYYKKMYNQMEYREGVIIGYSKGYNFDDNYVFGKASSYGVELLLKKGKGKINGQLSYTLSKTMREFPALNKGKAFPAKYDRLHDVSVVTNYAPNSKWTFSLVFVYGTGNALNLPVARYIIQENVVNEYGPRNAFRMPAYHRVDLSATYAVMKKKHIESYWIFSIYNIYNRRNPYYIYFETTGSLENYELSTSIKQVSLFPIIPAITYRIKF